MSIVPYLTIGDACRRAALLLAAHPLVRDPVISNSAGLPVKITQMRVGHDYPYDINNNGITLSVFPYNYQGTSNETVGSRNTALSFRPYEIGGKTTPTLDMCQLNLVVKLSTSGVGESVPAPLANNTAITVIYNHKELALQDWLLPLRQILLTNPISDLGGLVKNSTVDWGSCRSIKGTSANGENIIFHHAYLLWTLDLFTPREWRLAPTWYIPQPNLTPIVSWTYVGVLNLDGTPVYWDDRIKVLVTGLGYPLRFTPKGKAVVWDLVQDRFEDLDGNALTANDLLDPRTGTPQKTWIDTNLLLVGTLLPGRERLYWNKTTRLLQLFDGTVISILADGTPIRYDPDLGQVVNDTTSTPIVRHPNFLGLARGKVNVYDANSLELRDEFQF